MRRSSLRALASENPTAAGKEILATLERHGGNRSAAAIELLPTASSPARARVTLYEIIRDVPGLSETIGEKFAEADARARADRARALATHREGSSGDRRADAARGSATPVPAAPARDAVEGTIALLRRIMPARKAWPLAKLFGHPEIQPAGEATIRVALRVMAEANEVESDRVGELCFVSVALRRRKDFAQRLEAAVKSGSTMPEPLNEAELSETENRVLRALAEGNFTTREIAGKLGLDGNLIGRILSELRTHELAEYFHAGSLWGQSSAGFHAYRREGDPCQSTEASPTTDVSASTIGSQGEGSCQGPSTGSKSDTSAGRISAKTGRRTSTRSAKSRRRSEVSNVNPRARAKCTLGPPPPEVPPCSACGLRSEPGNEIGSETLCGLCAAGVRAVSEAGGLPAGIAALVGYQPSREALAGWQRVAMTAAQAQDSAKMDRWIEESSTAAEREEPSEEFGQAEVCRAARVLREAILELHPKARSLTDWADDPRLDFFPMLVLQSAAASLEGEELIGRDRSGLPLLRATAKLRTVSLPFGEQEPKVAGSGHNVSFASGVDDGETIDATEDDGSDQRAARAEPTQISRQRAHADGGHGEPGKPGTSAPVRTGRGAPRHAQGSRASVRDPRQVDRGGGCDVPRMVTSAEVTHSAAREHAAILVFLDAAVEEERRRRYPNVAAELLRVVNIIRGWTPSAVTPPLEETAARLLKSEAGANAREPLTTRLHTLAKGIRKGAHRKNALCSSCGWTGESEAPEPEPSLTLDDDQRRLLAVVRELAPPIARRGATFREIRKAWRESFGRLAEAGHELVARKLVEIEGSRWKLTFLGARACVEAGIPRAPEAPSKAALPARELSPAKLAKRLSIAQSGALIGFYARPPQDRPLKPPQKWTRLALSTLGLIPNSVDLAVPLTETGHAVLIELGHGTLAEQYTRLAPAEA